jgi:exosome complex RNA-binding protein Rrp42 (RNase PH superfamily)
MKVEI